MAFADDTTVFYPRKCPRRASGRVEFEQVFRQVFQEIRDGKTAPPFMDIQPKKIEIQRFGDTAIATFHLDDRAGFLNRRSIVLHGFPQGWKIVHLHASEVLLPEMLVLQSAHNRKDPPRIALCGSLPVSCWDWPEAVHSNVAPAADSVAKESCEDLEQKP